jgi:hypothetical protein
VELRFMEGEQIHCARMFAALMIGVERAILLFTSAGVRNSTGGEAARCPTHTGSLLRSRLHVWP